MSLPGLEGLSLCFIFRFLVEGLAVRTEFHHRGLCRLQLGHCAFLARSMILAPKKNEGESPVQIGPVFLPRLCTKRHPWRPFVLCELGRNSYLFGPGLVDVATTRVPAGEEFVHRICAAAPWRMDWTAPVVSWESKVKIFPY